MAQPFGISPRILIIEDRDQMAVEYLRALADAGYDARRARDGTEALRAAVLFGPHLIATRTGLPGRFDGRSLVSVLRAQRCRAKIVLRGDPHNEPEALLAMDAGADAWIGEEVGAQLFVRCVQSLLFPPCEGPARLTGIFRYAGFVIRLAHHPALSRIELDTGAAVRLSDKQVQLLGRLLQRPGEWVTQDELARSGWGLPLLDDTRHNLVVSAVYHLRRKLVEAAGAGGESIIRRQAGRYSIALPESVEGGAAAEGSLSLDSG
jgi:two-component system, OmpR family, KDP operon response regulator KdpE